MGVKMNNKIRNILLKLCEDGNEAYVVGGYVRDYLLGRETYDIDIATNLEPKEVVAKLNLNTSTDDNYGTIRFKDSIYNYDITTFRIENKYIDRKPVDIEYTNSMYEDASRRDFSINTMYMDMDSKIYDIYNGKQDLDDKIIKVVGSINDKMIDDPLRLLRAIRFAALLDFEIDEKLYNYIKQNKQLIRTLSYTRKKEELDKIFSCPNNKKGIKLIKELGLEDVLDIKINNELLDSSNLYGIWAQIEIDEEYNFSIKELDLIKKIKNILQYGLIDNVVLYQYGLYPSIIAGEMLEVEKSYISEIYKNLPIYSLKDIKLSGDDIIEILEIEPSEKIKNILQDIELNILNNKLENNYDELKNYILENWR